MTENLNEILIKNKQYIRNLKEKLGQKKVIIYGIGKFFNLLNSSGLFSDLNIIGICDKNYLLEDSNHEKFGYKMIAFENLTAYRPDYILVTVQKPLRPVNNL